MQALQITSAANCTTTPSGRLFRKFNLCLNHFKIIAKILAWWCINYKVIAFCQDPIVKSLNTSLAKPWVLAYGMQRQWGKLDSKNKQKQRSLSAKRFFWSQKIRKIRKEQENMETMMQIEATNVIGNWATDQRTTAAMLTIPAFSKTDLRHRTGILRSYFFQKSRSKNFSEARGTEKIYEFSP